MCPVRDYSGIVGEPRPRRQGPPLINMKYYDFDAGDGHPYAASTPRAQ